MTPNELREEWREWAKIMNLPNDSIGMAEGYWMPKLCLKLSNQKSDLKLALRERIKRKYGQCGLSDDLFQLIENL